MARMQLNPVAAPGGRYGRLIAGAVVAVAIVAIALIGTNVLNVNQPERLPAGVVGPAATATATPAPSPTLASVAVSGTTLCTTSSEGTTTTATTDKGDVIQMRDIVFTCDYSGFSDPRIRGVSNVNANVDEYADDSGDIWGTETMTTADGKWSGSMTGIIDKGYGTHRVATVLVGSGAYAGLQFRYTMTSDDQGATTKVTGTIEPVPSFQPSAQVAAPITISGTETCGASGGTRTTVGGVEQVRGEASSCTDELSDPRAASALSTRLYDYDIHPDGTATYWGTGFVSNGGGSWTGVWTGSVDKDGTFRVDASAFAGSEGYAGLQLRLTAVWTKDAAATTVMGTISPIRS